MVYCEMPGLSPEGGEKKTLIWLPEMLLAVIDDGALGICELKLNVFYIYARI